LPCFNPKPGWEERVHLSYSLIKNLLPSTAIGIILVNDGSTQNIDERKIKILQKEIDSFTYFSYQENKGKGYSLRLGIQHSEAPICIYTDVDFPYEEKSFIKVYNEVRNNNANIVVGVRNAIYYDHVPQLRKIISKFLRWMIRNVFSIKITDTQGGLKAFDKEGKRIFLQTTIDRYLFDLQFVYLASKDQAIRIVPVEVELKSDVAFSKMNPRILLTELLNFLRILRT